MALAVRPIGRTAGAMSLLMMSERQFFLIALAATYGLAALSLFIGVSDVSLSALLSGNADSRATQVLLISRVPRTIAILLSGTAIAVAGMIMQMLTRNRFVEPSTAGTVESASLGLLAVTILAPAMPLIGKMGVASIFALGGTALFLAILNRIEWKTVLIVPLVGLVLGGVISSVADFFAYRYDLLQTLSTWRAGDFSGVLRGRYELLWVTAVLTVLAYFAADRFTVAGMGEAFTTNLGLAYKRVMAFGLVIVSIVTAVIVVTVGIVPFLGLIVPNVVSLFVGDNMRRGLPWVALLGAFLVLVCDIAGRLIRFPYEIPVGTVMGVVGSVLFLYLLLSRRVSHG